MKNNQPPSPTQTFSGEVNFNNQKLAQFPHEFFRMRKVSQGENSPMLDSERGIFSSEGNTGDGGSMRDYRLKSQNRDRSVFNMHDNTEGLDMKHFNKKRKFMSPESAHASCFFASETGGKHQ